ncbi:MAG TPA: kynureninase [Cytophagaceae bacterium]|jgi:kynureninase|nr:kynureninase [Cytophagaceae bacterium]
MTLEYAKQLDEKDELKGFREKFNLPVTKDKPLIYFCGNSLGLQPKKTKEYFDQELNDWANLGVEGHFQGKNPWLHFHKSFSKSLSKITGAKISEVVAMNSLTVNLHLMLTTFYRPTAKRYKIIIEPGSFSSDVHAVTSQIKLHGLNPKNILFELKPRKGEFIIRTEEIVKQIERHKSDLALVLLGGVNYYTGQAFDMEVITKAVHKVGAKAGYDLAHAIGNIPLELHKWEVDFAVWCSYKYLNSGPGAVGGIFIHEKHTKIKTLPRLAGWWGHQEKTRFQMKPEFIPTPTAEGWQLSNAPVFNMIGHKASLEIFEEAGMKPIVKKSRSMTTFLEDMIKTQCKIETGYKIKIITPGSIDERGSQISIFVMKNGEELFQKITEAGFVVDWRSPNVIRVAPTPLYNSFEEVYLFAEFLSTCCLYLK